MKFSVIIPVYNVEAYLSPCLDSIVNQACQDLEIILIDDGSKDKSGQICDGYAHKYPEQVKVFHQENCGSHRSRIHGLQKASGEVCIFVDADDALRRDALAVLQKVFEETGADLVLYGASENADFAGDGTLLPFPPGQQFQGEGKKELYALMTVSEKLNTLWSKAAKRELYLRFLAEVNTQLPIPRGEDLYLSIPLITYAEKITYLGENLYFYRTREGSAVHSFHPALHRSIKIVRMEMEKYIDIWGIPECYPAFYAHVVHLWVNAVKKVLKNQSTLERVEGMSILQEMSGDEFFRKAYEKKQPGGLCLTDKILARWLYAGKFPLLKLTGLGFALLKKQKEKICRIFAK